MPVVVVVFTVSLQGFVAGFPPQLYDLIWVIVYQYQWACLKAESTIIFHITQHLLLNFMS